MLPTPNRPWSVWTHIRSNLGIPGVKVRAGWYEIKNGAKGISQRMLTLTLRNLERDGLLARHYFPEVPPRVEYELSTMGKSLLPALEAFTGWIRSNWPAIEQARRDFDSPQHAPRPSARPG